MQSSAVTGRTEVGFRRAAIRVSPLHARHPIAARHLVRCPYCSTEFDLFAAVWCEHQEAEASKRCPSCERCLCAHPAYAEPLFWKEAPEAFKQRGFRQLFLFYL